MMMFHINYVRTLTKPFRSFYVVHLGIGNVSMKFYLIFPTRAKGL